jgi:hypothetical protein
MDVRALQELLERLAKEQPVDLQKVLDRLTDDDDLGWSIKATSAKTSESVWKVKERLRLGQYEAKKADRRTIVIPASVRKFWATLPAAKYTPPRPRKISEVRTVE